MKLNLIQQLVLLSLLYYQVQCYLQHYETQMNRSKRESQHFMDELFARTSEHIEGRSHMSGKCNYYCNNTFLATMRFCNNNKK